MEEIIEVLETEMNQIRGNLHETLTWLSKDECNDVDEFCDNIKVYHSYMKKLKLGIKILGKYKPKIDQIIPNENN